MNKKYTTGVVLRDETRNFKNAQIIRGDAANLQVAKTLALKLPLQKAQEINHPRIIIEGDVLNVIYSIQGHVEALVWRDEFVVHSTYCCVKHDPLCELSLLSQLDLMYANVYPKRKILI